MKKIIFAALGALSLAGTAVAEPFYIDVGSDYGGSAETVDGPSTTGWKDQLTVAYQSQSVVTDTDGSGIVGGFTVGDTILSRGGLIDSNLIVNNKITNLLPSETLGTGPSNNGYDANWVISFRFDDLFGVFNGFDFIYQSGNVDFFLFDQNSGGFGNEIHLFTVSITGHTSVPGNQVFSGELGNFGTDVIAGNVRNVVAGDVFNSDQGSFQDSDVVQWRLDQNSDLPQITGIVGDQISVDGTQHDASIRFQIPEPNMIAMFGLGLLGLARFSRRRLK